MTTAPATPRPVPRPVPILADLAFAAMGTDLRVLVEGPGPAAHAAAAAARAFLRDFDARLSRFRLESELSRLNADPRAEVPASPLLRALVRVALDAAAATGGLVDPTLVGALVAAGYGASRAGVAPAPLALALAGAPHRRPAAPHPAARWRAVAVDDARGTIRRPPGVALDSGGVGKGLAADLAGARLGAFPRWAVDCGGDLRVGGDDVRSRPFEVEVRHPLTGAGAHVLRLSGGAVATSGIDGRLWRTPGGYAHHLLDPSTGRPAWTGLLAVTALAPTGAEAEALAKAALLGGPGAARAALGRHGGLLVHDDGDVELAGPLRARPSIRVTLPRPRRTAA